MNELVQRLANGQHPIVVEHSASPRELREQIQRGFVLLKFPNTRGGTALGSQLDMEQTRLDGADFEKGTGSAHLVGKLTLNYDRVQLVADIDLVSLRGTGQLILIEEAAGSHVQAAGNHDAASTGSESTKANDADNVSNGEQNAAAADSKSQETKKAARRKTRSKPGNKTTGRKAV